MATPASPGHLGAAGREVVFCHACQHEWYHDEHESITCPRCQSSFTEIVSALLPAAATPAHMSCQVESANDPREAQVGFDFSAFNRAPNPFLRRPPGSDSDPEEGDIEDHLHPGTSSASGPSNPDAYPRHRANARGRANPMETDALRRFAEILNDLGGPTRTARPAGPGGLFPPEDRAPQPGARFQRTTFQTGPFGSVTFTSGTVGTGPEAPPVTMGTYVIPLTRGDTHPSGPQPRAIAIIHHRATNSGDPPRLLDQLFGNPWGQGGPNNPNNPEARRDRGAQPPFAGGLADLLSSLYNPTAGIHGDAVFSQEALDRIVTQLMEASPHTNAAPPASQTAIESLEKKQVDDEMLGPEGKAECTICIDELKKGDEVVVLPCKHWYHGECVTLWLKEHNTCPVCRMPIESRPADSSGNNNNPNPNPNNNNNNPNPNPNNNNNNSSPSPISGSQSPSTPAYTPSSYSLSPFTFTSLTARPRPDQRPVPRSARENAERLNAIRNLAGGSSSSNPYRRNSHSPTGQATPSDEEAAARAARVRTDSWERDRGTGTAGGWEWAEYTRAEADGSARRVSPRGEGQGWDWAEFGPIGGRGSSNLLQQPYQPYQQQQQQNQNQQQQGQNQQGQGQQQQQQGQGQGQGGSGNGNGNGNASGNGSGGGSGSGGGGAFSWIRDHFGRRSQ